MKALIDTTILVDATLTTGAQGLRARAALGRYEENLLPHYAIKEFKRGALHNYVWFHTKVSQLPSWAEAIEAIRRTMGFKKNLPSTALQALVNFESSIENSLTDEIASKYPGMGYGQMKRIEGRVWLKQHVMRAWRKRRKLFSAVIAPLSCYVERAPSAEANGLLIDAPLNCKVPDCCMRTRYRLRLADVERLEKACTGPKKEVSRRREALNRLRRHPTQELEEKYCIWLGDAVFALECPAGAVILTTNVVDHDPLARAVGRTVQSP